MTKIKNYVSDEAITGDDKWIGSDAGHGFATKNFTALKLAEYFNSASSLNSGDAINFKYIPNDSGRADTSISFDTPSIGIVPFVGVDHFIISKVTLQLVHIDDYAVFFKGKKCLMYDTEDVNSFFLFRVIDVVVHETDFLRFTIEYLDSNGGFVSGNNYGITIKDLSGSGDSGIGSSGDRIILSNGFTLAGSTFTLLSGWQWVIDNVDYTNAADVPINIPLASSGKQRLDIIALDASNSAVRVAGAESETTPVAPALPANTLQATIILADNTSTGIVGKEDLSNKQNSLNHDGTGNKYPTVDTVNEAFLRNTRLFARTGIANKNDQFELVVFDLNTATIKPVDSVVFWDELFVANAVSNDAVKSFPQINYPLSQLVTATGGNINTNPIVTDGVYVRYLGYDKDGNVVSSPESFIESSSVAQLGFVTVINSSGDVTFLGGITPGARNVFSQPVLANLNDLDRITVTATTDITINYNTATPSLKSLPGTITGIAINWRGPNNPNNTSPIDKFSYLGDDIVDFVSIDPLTLSQTAPFTPHTLWTESQDGLPINESFFNTTSELRESLASGAFAVKRVLIGVRGGIFVQEGEFATSAAYANIDEAKANVFTHEFTDTIIPPGLVIELARIIYKKGVADFSNENEFFLVMTAGGSGGGGIASSVGDATTATKGIVKLAGDLAGTADLPTVPELANKELLSNKKTVISGNEASDSFYGSIKAWIDYLKQGFIALLPAKATVLVDADFIVIGDSDDSNKTKTRTFAQFRSNIGTIVPNVQSGTTYTLVASDNGKQIITTNSAAVTITIPTGLGIGFNCEVKQQGTGQATVSTSGTTLQYLDYELPTTYSQKSLIFIDNIPNLTETYQVYGQTSMI